MTCAGVLTWDWREQPDFEKLTAICAELGVAVFFRHADTGSDEYGLVVTTRPVDADTASFAYEAWRDASLCGGDWTETGGVVVIP